jgi:hypothetical protein
VQIKVVTTIPFPLADVFEATRDHMPDLASFMPNIDVIEVESREEHEDGSVSLVNRWTAAATEIPAMARTFVNPKDIFWLDRAHWKPGETRCTWELEMGFMADRINCSGTTAYTSVGDESAEMRIDGELTLDLKGLVPRMMLGTVTKGIEKFVGKLVEPNFQKTSDALTAYLRTQRTNQ